MNETRKKRIENLILELVSSLIMRKEIKDPRVSSFLSITRVDIANDISAATVYLSTIESDSVLEESVKAMNNAAGFIQKKISPRLKMRMTPRLKFKADRSLRDGFEVSRKLDELKNDKQPDSVE